MTDQTTPPPGSPQQQQQAHGCVVNTIITFAPLDVDVPGLPKYPPDPSVQFRLAPDDKTPDPVAVHVPQNPDLSGGGAVDEDVGMFPTGFDSAAQQSKAASEFPFVDFVPSVFQRRPLRQVSAIPVPERLETLRGFSQVVAANITFVKISGCGGGGVSPASAKSIGKMISMCVNAEVVVLRKLGIEKLSDFVLPRVRHCDFAENEVKSISDCEAFACKSPLLEVFNLVENPVSKKQDFFSRIIGLLPLLEVLNEKEISPEVRFRCVAALGRKDGDTKTAIKDLDSYRWDLVISSVPQVVEMKKSSSHSWQPAAISKLILRDQGLTFFHVGPFANLHLLDLHGNAITDLRGTGMERLEFLDTLDLSQNQLRNKESLSVLCFLPSLRKLRLSGNAFDPKEYVPRAIYETRHARGTNRAYGLLELDGKLVSIQQRVEAVRQCTPSDQDPPDDIEAYRLELALIAAIGHAQLRTPSYLRAVKVLSLSGCGLGAAIDVSRFPALEVLDLSSNNLVHVRGVESAPLLRVIDVSGNPSLKLVALLSALSTHKTLQSVSFAVEVEGHKRYTMRKSYRKKVLRSLLFKNPTLVLLDKLVISVPERVAALAATGAEASEVEKYRFNLALTVSCTTHPTSYNPDKVGVGIQYDPARVTSLRRMNDVGLRSDFCNLAPFTALEELDLSRNGISDLLVMGLQLLKRLKALDVSDNKVETPLARIAELIDSLPALICIALRGNPVMKGDEDRKKLLGMLKSMLQPGPMLRIVDTEITVEERIAVMQAGGGGGGNVAEVAEAMRFNYAMLYRAPPEKRHWANLHVLDLSRTGIAVADFSNFTGLRTLLLRGNRISVLSAIRGLSDLKSLTALDVRDNELTQIEPIVATIGQLPALQSIGISGNKLGASGTVSPREKLIRMLPSLWKIVRLPFGSIDDAEITVQEIASAAAAVDHKAVAPTREVFRFKVALMRRMPGQIPLDIVTELKLDGCGLSAITFTEMVHLTRLSLGHNEIHASDLEKSGLDRLAELKALDISHNKIKDSNVILKKIVPKIVSLDAIWVIPNPCFPADTPEYRRKMASCRKAPLRLLDGRPLLPSADLM